MENVEYINDCLKRYPEDIYKATVLTEDLREKWLLTDARKDYESAKSFLLAKSENMTDGMSKAKAAESIYETACAVVTSESSYRRALADQMRLENEFTGIRKQAELLKLTEQHMARAA